MKKWLLVTLPISIFALFELFLLLDYAYLRNNYQMDETTQDSINAEVKTWGDNMQLGKDRYNLVTNEIENTCGHELSAEIHDIFQSTYNACYFSKNITDGTLRESFSSGIFRYKLRKIFNPLSWFSK